MAKLLKKKPYKAMKIELKEMEKAVDETVKYGVLLIYIRCFYRLSRSNNNKNIHVPPYLCFKAFLCYLLINNLVVRKVWYLEALNTKSV